MNGTVTSALPLMFTFLVTFVCARTLYTSETGTEFLTKFFYYLSWNTISLPNLMNISNELSAKNYEWQPWIPYQMTFGWRCFLFFLRKIFSELLLFVGPGKDCHVTALSGHALISNRTPDRSERILYWGSWIPCLHPSVDNSTSVRIWWPLRF